MIFLQLWLAAYVSGTKNEKRWIVGNTKAVTRLSVLARKRCRAAPWGPGQNCVRGDGRIKGGASTQAVRGLGERDLYPGVLRAGSGVQGKITGVRGPGQWRGLG